jgi:hypothetical protein
VNHEEYFLSAVATLCSTNFPRDVTADLDVFVFRYFKHTLESRNFGEYLLKLFKIN